MKRFPLITLFVPLVPLKWFLSPLNRVSVNRANSQRIINFTLQITMKKICIIANKSSPSRVIGSVYNG